MNEDIEIRKKVFIDKLKQSMNFKTSKVFYILSFIAITICAWYVRTRNLPLLQGKYLIELDSYFFFRYAKTIFETGALPAIDLMRYVPEGASTAPYAGFPYTMAYLYKIIHFFAPSIPQITWHVMYPPIITVIGFIFFFLFVRELFDKRIAIVATAFLAVIPAYIQRTSAGFADHEAMAMLWIFAALWLFAKAWKSEKISHAVIFGIASGLLTSLAAGTWGGYRYASFTLGLFALFAAFFLTISNQNIMSYASWAITHLITGVLILKINVTYAWFIGIDNVFLFSGLIIMLLSLIFSKIELLKKIKIMPQHLAIIISAVIAFALGLTAYMRTIVISIAYKQTSRFGTTVAESMQTYFFGGNGLYQETKFLIILAFIGAGICIYKIFKDKSEHKLITKFSAVALALYALFVLFFILGKYGKSFPLSLAFFDNYYFYVFALMLAGFFVLHAYLYYAQKSSFDMIFVKNNWQYIFVFAFFLLAITQARAQIRLLFGIAPAVAILSAVALIKIKDFLQTKLPEKYKVYKGKNVLAVLFSLLVIYLFYVSAAQSVAGNRGMGSMVPGQWESAMDFIRENTPNDAVVAQWWDYGYMIQTVGERATVTDGGNIRPWNWAPARFFLTGKDPTTTLEYLKTHNVTHILISEEEIPKYPAFSLIGSESDTNLDRYSQIGIFTYQQQREVRDGTMLIYSGGWPLDNNLVVGNLVLPSGGAAVGGISMIVSNTSISNPTAYIVYNNQQYAYSITCAYINGQKQEFAASPDMPVLTGCAVFAPLIIDQNQANAIGTIFWLSEKVYDTNFARLYMYGETDPNFKLVYSDNNPLGIYQGRVIGPIKIWEVEYPAGVKTDDFYLKDMTGL